MNDMIATATQRITNPKMNTTKQAGPNGTSFCLVCPLVGTSLPMEPEELEAELKSSLVFF
jgi:hypothetical protein